MVRPGLAQTQAVLARELSGGTDDASRLFRQSVALSRQVERARIELARLEDLAKPTPEEAVRTRTLRSAPAGLAEGAARNSGGARQLPPLPRRVERSHSARRPAEAAPARRGLLPDDQVGDSIYAVLVTPAAAHAARLDATSKQLDEQVDALRDTISTVENGQRTTYAFDVGLSHQLFTELFGPFAADLGPVKHLIFEPDGAMLRLPPNLLVMDQASVDAYKKRAAAGRRRRVRLPRDRLVRARPRHQTSVSPRSFADLRTARPSAAPRDYLGFGENTPPSGSAAMIPAAADRDCILPFSSWTHPISAKELQIAAGIVSTFDPKGVQVVTGNAFTDTGARVTHRPRPIPDHPLRDPRRGHRASAEVRAQPALLTSFGGNGSDGLLTFREIFDLHLDADLVILSACDTAGKASAAATQQAGLGRGGDVSLDGLVRAFVGAGGRLVIASHWPLPDDYNATQRLITGMFSAPPGTPTVTALQAFTAPADGRPEHVAPLLLVGVRGGRRWRDPGDPREAGDRTGEITSGSLAACEEPRGATGNPGGDDRFARMTKALLFRLLFGLPAAAAGRHSGRAVRLGRRRSALIRWRGRRDLARRTRASPGERDGWPAELAFAPAPWRARLERRFPASANRAAIITKPGVHNRLHREPPRIAATRFSIPFG